MDKTATLDKPTDIERHVARFMGKTIKLDHDPAEEQKTIRTVIPFIAKSIDDETRTIEFIGSTATVDRYGDSIVQAGWELGNFTKNPVIPWGHDYSEPPIAQAVEVGLREGNLFFKGKFASIAELSSDPEHPSDYALFTDAIYNAYRGGYLRAFSVGFIPLEFDGNYKDGYIFTKCELLEVSCVTVPANPEALTLAFREGVLDERHKAAMLKQAKRLISSLTKDTESPITISMNDEAKAYIDEKIDLVLNAIATLKAADPEAPAETAEPSEDEDGGTNKQLDFKSAEVRSELKSIIGESLNHALGVIE